MRIRFSGFGGQGIVLCGMVFGRAAMLDGRNSIQTQSYGSASRGGLTRSDVNIEDGEIYDLIYDELDVLVTLSTQAYGVFRRDLAEDGVLFYESDLVEVDEAEGARAHGLPATDIAFKQFGRKIMANMVVMGYVNRLLGVVSHESLVRTVRDAVPAGTEDVNEAALAEGARLAAERTT